jgi:hypothetical protein
VIKRQLFCSERLWWLKSTETMPMLHKVKKSAGKHDIDRVKYSICFWRPDWVWSTLVARGSCIFHLIPARIYFTRGKEKLENLWWHTIQISLPWLRTCKTGFIFLIKLPGLSYYQNSSLLNLWKYAVRITSERTNLRQKWKNNIYIYTCNGASMVVLKGQQKNIGKTDRINNY